MIRQLVLLTAATASTAASAQDLPARYSVACRGTTTYTRCRGRRGASPEPTAVRAEPVEAPPFFLRAWHSEGLRQAQPERCWQFPPRTSFASPRLRVNPS